MIILIIILGFFTVVSLISSLVLFVRFEGKIQALTAYAVAYNVVLYRENITDKKEMEILVDRALKIIEQEK
jgi:hypothetical protein